MATNNTPFKDLELTPDEINSMLHDPEGFAKKVYEKTDELREICKADTSTAALTRRFEEDRLPADRTFHSLLNGFYSYADEYPVEMMPSLIELAEQFVKDLKDAFKDRVIYEAANRTDSISDKKYASELYADVRRVFNGIVDFMNGFKGTDLKKLPALPGNYGSQNTSLRHYVYVLNGETFRNPRAVCHELGIEPVNFYTDLQKIADEHPEYGIIFKAVM